MTAGRGGGEEQSQKKKGGGAMWGRNKAENAERHKRRRSGGGQAHHRLQRGLQGRLGQVAAPDNLAAQSSILSGRDKEFLRLTPETPTRFLPVFFLIVSGFSSPEALMWLSVLTWRPQASGLQLRRWAAEPLGSGASAAQSVGLSRARHLQLSLKRSGRVNPL